MVSFFDVGKAASNLTTQQKVNLYAGLPATSGGSGGSSASGGSSGVSAAGGGGYAAQSSGGGGASGAVSSAYWGCPSGATLVKEPGGTGNLVCRWNHNGALFAAQPKAPTTTQPSPGEGDAGAPGGEQQPLPDAPMLGVDAPDKTAEWLQAAGSIMARDPQAMLAVRLKDKYGDDGGNSLYGMLSPYADAANALFMGQMGMNANNGTIDDNLGWLEDYWNTLQTPGARINTGAALNNIFTAGGTDSPLNAYLTTGDPSQQANSAIGLIRGAVDTGMSPIMARSIMDRLNLERDRYLGESARGNAVGSFIDYLRSAGINVGQLMGVG